MSISNTSRPTRYSSLSLKDVVMHSYSPDLAFVEDMLVTQLALNSHLPLIQKLFVILRGKPGACQSPGYANVAWLKPLRLSWRPICS
jgi:hypothetical protein